MATLRLSEKWFNRGLWLVAIAFAFFLVGLGNTVIGDLPKVEARLTIADFVDKAEHARLKAVVDRAVEEERKATQASEQARLRHRAAQADLRTARESHAAWLATRSVTKRADQDPEVIERTGRIDALARAERAALAEVEVQQKRQLDATQSANDARHARGVLESGGREKLEQAERALELRVFLYRLLLTLPVLAAGAWLFARKRKSSQWPFVWGFIIFAVFTFFVELVPYLPSYGGYVRYTVGIVVTFFVGRYAIRALTRYLEEQKKVEALPDDRRRKELSYDLALGRLAKGVCPGCERPVDLKSDNADYCPHCGIGIFGRCSKCATRTSAFSPYCFACGYPAAGKDAAASMAAISSS